ncbi:MAG TPA: hypothetical protein VI814_09180 [Candidatus Limnocylindria bacterium]
MTTSFRSLTGIVFAALLALALIVMTTDAVAASRSLGGGTNILDPGFGGSQIYYHPKPIGRFGVTWE